MADSLYLIDGSALYYQSYYAFIRNPLINSKGEDTSVTFGFLLSMVRLIEEQSPTHIAIIFDARGPTFRHELYSEYKATRKKMPEEMAAQLPRLTDTLKRLNFIMMDKPGYEADDIIGALTQKYASPDLDVFIVSNDKDMAQLVNEHTFLFKQGKNNQPAEILDAAGVKEKFGIRPEQVIDWLVLMGDSSDNIPGIPKVGKVTAAKLLNQYNSVSEIYENIDDVEKKSVRENLITHRGQTVLARQLATIKLDTPVEIDLKEMRFDPWDMQEATAVLKELEFNRLLKRVQKIAQGEEIPEDFSKHDKRQVSYRLIDSLNKLDEIVLQLSKQPLFVFDMETSSLDFLTAEIAGFALAWEEGKACYIPVNHPDIALNEKSVLDKLRPIFSNPAIKKVAQNIKFDAMILREHGLEIQGMYFDTMIASYLLNPSGQHSLDKLAEHYLNYEMIHINSLIGSGKNQKKMTEIPTAEAAPYAAEDADIELKLYHKFSKMITEYNMEDLLFSLEMPLVPVLMEMEKNGVTLDVELLKKLSIELGADNAKLEESIYHEAGEEFNLNSPQQLGNILFEKLEIHKQLGFKRPKRTKTGQYSTSESTLEKYLLHPVVEDVLNYRKLTKLKNTYIDVLPKLISPVTGRVHTSFNQAVTATGRLSSSNPNLQNIPIRTKVGRQIRKAFIPSQKERLMLSVDYSQIELRIMAHFSGDENMRQSFNRKLDIHAATAAQVFNVPIDDVDGDQRRKAKEINFGIIYGMSRFGLAGRLHISIDEAEEFIAEYMATYPGVDLFMKKMILTAREQGFVETMMHRRRYLPEINSDNGNIRQFAERMAINTPIQGSAADLIKKSMIDIQQFIHANNIPAKMLLQVHDELVFEVEKSIIDDFAISVKRTMENAWKLSVPLIAETGIGENWLEAHD